MEADSSGGGRAVNTELWSGMLLVSEHASSFSYERPLKDDGMLTTPLCATIAPLFTLLTRAAGIVRSVLVICGFQNLFPLVQPVSEPWYFFFSTDSFVIVRFIS